ncbi:MAG: HlyD family efflux transporter periplasmic adaptor subunit [Bacteroidetes bacterium]|nr:HlyD family efflux transporter periplasmic adaptor subunit [Bacteroidota bacterium]
METENDIQGLIGSPRGWLFRWGMSSLLILLLLFLIFSALFRYPDKLEATVRILAGSEPAEVAARENGTLEKVLVADQSVARVGDWLAILQNSAQATEIKILKAKMDSWSLSANGLSGIQLPDRAPELGMVQSAYARFEQQLEAISAWLAADRTSSRIASINRQIADLEEVRESLLRQEKILTEELRMADSTYERQQALYEKGGISLLELEGMERLRYRTRRDLENLSVRKAENSRERQSLFQDQLQLEDVQGKWLADELPVLRQYYQDLSTAILEWENRYVLKAPKSGLVSHSAKAGENKVVQAGEVLFTIVSPDAVNGWKGRAQLPSEGAGKVALGDLVEVEVFDYPAGRFGILEGSVATLSLTPESGTYGMEVALPDSLITTFGERLPFRPVYEGQASVITEKRSLLLRLIDSFR